MKAKTPKRIDFMLKLLARRRADFERERDMAVAVARWSQVAGNDGIATGIYIAEMMLLDEFKRKR